MIQTLKTESYTLNMYQTDQFKTTRIRVSFASPKDLATITHRGLLPYVMKSGSMTYPDKRAITKHLEDLYQAYFTASVESIGETHLVYFDVSVIDDFYTIDNQSLLEKALSFLHDVIYNPSFLESQFEEEKRLMSEYFDGIYNNKMAYAQQELRNSMLENEDYRIPPLGEKELLDTIVLDEIKQVHKRMLDQDSVSITVVGNIDFTQVKDMVEDHFNVSPRSNFLSFIDSTSKQVEEVKELTVIQDVRQAKYIEGYRLPIRYGSPLYHAALVLDTLLGGSAESILHLRVREELNLCYFIGSSYDSKKGLWFVKVGMDAEKKDTVKEEINKAISSVINQNYDSELFDIAKAINVSRIISSKDSNASLAVRLERMTMYGESMDFPGKIKAIQDVTKDQVSQVAKELILDTTCILRGDSNE
jgi:predicted Zn-dependent peptidase